MGRQAHSDSWAGISASEVESALDTAAELIALGSSECLPLFKFLEDALTELQGNKDTLARALKRANSHG